MPKIIHLDQLNLNQSYNSADYLTRLLKACEDIDRGYHLIYYGDQHFNSNAPMVSTGNLEKPQFQKNRYNKINHLTR
jgi:hypothetical protein